MIKKDDERVLYAWIKNEHILASLWGSLCIFLATGLINIRDKDIVTGNAGKNSGIVTFSEGNSGLDNCC